MQAMIKVVFLAAVIGVVGSKAPTAFHSFNKAGMCMCACVCLCVKKDWFWGPMFALSAKGKAAELSAEQKATLLAHVSD